MKEYVTADLYLSAAICTMLDINPAFKFERGRVLFSFPMSDALHGAMNNYNAGAPINAYEFAQTIKRLRGEMMAMRNVEKMRS